MRDDGKVLFPRRDVDWSNPEHIRLWHKLVAGVPEKRPGTGSTRVP